jgi:F-type H+-transporting ATPase subunit a
MNKAIFSPLEQFEILPLIPLRLGAVDISFTNASLLMIICASLVVLLVQLVAANGNGLIVPSRWQSIVESIYLLLVAMVYESVGEKGGQFLALIFALFSFILSCNLVGLIPYSYTVTSHLVITLALSTGIWVGKLLVGLRYHGFKVFGIFIPAGAPFAMLPFFVFLEIIGFVIPLISLAVRLFANMMAGHILLKILFGFAWKMMMASGLLFIAHLLPLSVLFLLLGLETAVALIQAYVFALLTCIYIGDMYNGGH